MFNASGVWHSLSASSLIPRPPIFILHFVFSEETRKWPCVIYTEHKPKNRNVEAWEWGCPVTCSQLLSTLLFSSSELLGVPLCTTKLVLLPFYTWCCSHEKIIHQILPTFTMSTKLCSHSRAEHETRHYWRMNRNQYTSGINCCCFSCFVTHVSSYAFFMYRTLR